MRLLPLDAASKHAHGAGHPLVQSFEPGEDWFWDYAEGVYRDGPSLAPPHSHPSAQPAPGPAGRVPPDWERHLH